MKTSFGSSAIASCTSESNGNQPQIWPQVENRTTVPYDKEDSQSVYKAGTTVNTMTYTGDGQRITRRTSTKLTTYAWDGSDYI